VYPGSKIYRAHDGTVAIIAAAATATDTAKKEQGGKSSHNHNSNRGGGKCHLRIEPHWDPSALKKIGTTFDRSVSQSVRVLADITYAPFFRKQRA
jgi:hypothetical protein